MKAVPIIENVKRIMTARSLNFQVAAAEIGLDRSTLSRIVRGKHDSIDDDNAEKIFRWFRANVQHLNYEGVTSSRTAGVKMVKVYGMAQALGAQLRQGDIVPESEYDLPVIPVADDGRRVVAFLVEGDSMLPTLRPGWHVLCDIDAKPANGNIVAAKWDQIVTVKRYRRVGDTVLLTSENSAAGADYEVPASKIEWCLKVVAFHGNL